MLETAVWVRLELRTFQGRKVEGFNKKQRLIFWRKLLLKMRRNQKILKYIIQTKKSSRIIVLRQGFYFKRSCGIHCELKMGMLTWCKGRPAGLLGKN